MTVARMPNTTSCTPLFDRVIPPSLREKYMTRERFRKHEVIEIFGCSETTFESYEMDGQISGIAVADKIVWYYREMLEEYLKLKKNSRQNQAR